MFRLSQLLGAVAGAVLLGTAPAAHPVVSAAASVTAAPARGDLLTRLAAGPDGFDVETARRVQAEARGAELFAVSGDVTLGGRRARARWFDRYGATEAFDGALAALAVETDRAARRDLLHGLAVHADGAPARAKVAAALDALDGASATERAAAAVTLGGEEGAALLDRWIDAWPSPDRERAAEALGELRVGARRVEDRLTGPGAERLPHGVHAELLAAHGRWFGEDASGADAPRRRAPIELGLRHPSPQVRAAARFAVERFLLACRRLERPDRADALLAALAAAERDPRPYQARRAEHALSEGMDPAVARDAAARIEGTAALDPSRSWAARASYYRGMAALAADDAELARESFDRAAALLDEALAERVDLALGPDDLSRPGTGEAQSGRLADRASLELARALLAIAEGRAAGDLVVLEHARRAHAYSLESQVAAAAADGLDLGTVDLLLEADTSPTRLLFARPPHDAWPVERGFAARRELGRALASVAPFEFRGFDPVEGLPSGVADPREDPLRAHWLSELPEARRRTLREELRELERRAIDAARAGDRLPPQEETEIAILRWRLDQEVDDPPMEDLRAPSSMSLWLAQDLRGDGRSGEARELAERLLAALEADELDAKTGMGLNLAIEAQLVIGGSLTDEGRGAEAEEALKLALDRLEGLENLFLERDGGEAAAANARRRRAGALVSLAVNANVKLQEPERALAYFEEAHALAPDEAGDVLLACYRARMGQDEEAREILGRVFETPGDLYNLACTHALLGDADRALDYLERDFRENHPSAGSLRRQQEWARSDPDLASLTEDPRFEALLAASPDELLAR